MTHTHFAFLTALAAIPLFASIIMRIVEWRRK